MEEDEEEENMCDGAIYADPGRRSRCRPKGGLSPGYAHRVGFLSGGGITTWGVISGGLTSKGLSLAFSNFLLGHLIVK